MQAVLLTFTPINSLCIPSYSLHPFSPTLSLLLTNQPLDQDQVIGRENILNLTIDHGVCHSDAEASRMGVVPDFGQLMLQSCKEDEKLWWVFLCEKPIS